MWTHVIVCCFSSGSLKGSEWGRSSLLVMQSSNWDFAKTKKRNWFINDRDCKQILDVEWWTFTQIYLEAFNLRHIIGNAWSAVETTEYFTFLIDFYTLNTFWNMRETFKRFKFQFEILCERKMRTAQWEIASCSLRLTAFLHFFFLLQEEMSFRSMTMEMSV